jgi:CubicO group peptidase (beta-lactamase class C family)
MMRSMRARLALPLLLAACAPAPLPVASSPALPQAPALPPTPALPPAPAQRFADAPPVEAFADPARRAKLASAFPAIDALVAAELAAQDLPGLALGVVVDGELAHASFAGARDLDTKAPIDADTVFRVGSITKTFTATALLAPRDEGKLALDDPATKLLPELAGVVYGAPDAAPITLRQMITHTSGMPRNGAFDFMRADREVTREELLRPLAGLALERAPGAAYAYSNYAVSLVGLAIERVEGAPYREVVERRITRPLGMTTAAWDASAVPAAQLATGYAKKGGRRERVLPWRLGASEASGGLFLSLADLARWAAFQLDAWPARGGADDGPLRRASRREMHTSTRSFRLRVGARPDAARGEPSVGARVEGIGLGWHGVTTCEEELVLMHGGTIDGFGAQIDVLPMRGVAVVVLSNDVGAAVERVASKAIAALRKTGGLEARTAPPRATPALDQALARLLRVQNAWDEAAYRAMLSEKHRRSVPADAERAELAEYHARHGRCEPGPAITAGATQARFAPRCERGTFEIVVTVDDEGRIGGFTGLSRGVAPPAAVTRAAAASAGLLDRWSDATYRRWLAKLPKPKADLEKLLAGLRAEHGRCAAPTPWQTEGTSTHRFRLACERGGDLEMGIALADGDEAHVGRLFFEAQGEPTCPVR